MYFRTYILIGLLILGSPYLFLGQFYSREMLVEMAKTDTREAAYKENINLGDSLCHVWEFDMHANPIRKLTYSDQGDTIEYVTLDSTGNSFGLSFWFNLQLGDNGYRVKSDYGTTYFTFYPNGKIKAISFAKDLGLSYSISYFENGIVSGQCYYYSEDMSRLIICNKRGKVIFDGDLNRIQEPIVVRKGKRWWRKNSK